MTRRAQLLALSLVLAGGNAAGGVRQAPQAAERIRTAPRFRAGETLRYQIDFRTQTSSHTTGAIENPQGAAQIDLAVSLLVRLDVLAALPAVAADAAEESQPAENWRARMRVTYEKSSVVVGGDSYDPAAGDLEAQYRKLQGRSMEFTLEAGGAVEEITGLEEIMRDQTSLAAVRGWLAQLASGTAFPREGVALGQEWAAQRSVAESPLADTILETHSTYVRNEKCRVAEGVGGDAAPGSEVGRADTEMCAVIMTRYEMKQRGKSRRANQDSTPESLSLRGLRSFGTWTSSGESLTFLSLVTGLTISVTQSGAEAVNLTIARANGGAPIAYTARIHSETHIILLPESTAPAPAAPAANPPLQID